jgi:hypothetical protein
LNNNHAKTATSYRKNPTEWSIGIVSIILISIFTVATFVLTPPIGFANSGGQIATGARFTIQSASISNSTNKIPCTFTSSLWSCKIAHVAVGTNLTTFLLVKNAGTKLGYAYSNSTVISGREQGTLIDQYSMSNPLGIKPGDAGILKVIFVVYTNAMVGASIRYNTTIY